MVSYIYEARSRNATVRLNVLEPQSSHSSSCCKGRGYVMHGCWLDELVVKL